MSSSTNNAFLAWLDAELAQRRWSYHQLARRAGVSHSTLGRLRRGAVPGWGLCHALAGAFDLPPEHVLRQAGLLPPVPPEQAEYEEFRRLLARLSQDDRRELLEIARLKLSLDQTGPVD